MQNRAGSLIKIAIIGSISLQRTHSHTATYMYDKMVFLKTERQIMLTAIRIATTVAVYVQRHQKTCFCKCENTKISCTVTPLLISVFVFAKLIYVVHSFYFQTPKRQASSYLMWLYSPVCVGPGWKHRSN